MQHYSVSELLGWCMTLPYESKEDNRRAFQYHISDMLKRKCIKSRKILVFLRRACIFEFCIFSDSFDQRIDWDEKLSPTQLFLSYNLGEITHEFPRLLPFTFVDLPEEFILFLKKPGLDMKRRRHIFYSLLTGDVIDGGWDELGEWGRRVMKGTFCPVLALGGPRATSSFYFVFGDDLRMKNRDVLMRVMYTDEFGATDVGLFRGLILRLCPDVVDAEIDRLLSHRWTDQIV
jgi:hypothetical protein